MRHFHRALFAWLFFGCAAAALADVRVPGLFGDNMVLQRERPAAVWGAADPGESVTVKFGTARAAATADAAGRWRVQLPAMPASPQPRQLSIAGRNQLLFHNVLVGDVWVCAGQSNMELSLGSCNAPQDIAAARFPLLRWLKPAKRQLGWPGAEVAGRWSCCAPDTAPALTAVGFYFARRVQQETGVPLGLLDLSWSGSAIEPWLPAAAFTLEPALSNILAQLKKPADAYRAKAQAQLSALEKWIPAARRALDTVGAEIPPAPPLPADPVIDEHFPTTIFNGMVHPVVPFAIRGVLWYQGESNGGEGVESYRVKMRALIRGWRQAWQQDLSTGSGPSPSTPSAGSMQASSGQAGSGSSPSAPSTSSGQGFPFYFVQLANYEPPCATPAAAGPYARNREAQLLTLQLPRTGMAVAVDVGEEKDIHPKNKFDVGERLARWALHNDYGRRDLVPSGPLYKAMQVEGNRIRVRFDYVGAGLMAGKKDGRQPVIADPEGKFRQFAVAGADKKWYWADAVVDGDTLLVSSPQVPKPVAVRYAYDHNPAGCNFYNKDGLPASPFRTDNW